MNHNHNVPEKLNEWQEAAMSALKKLEKAEEKLDRATVKIREITLDRDEYKRQHENLVAVRLQDLAALQNKIDLLTTHSAVPAVQPVMAGTVQPIGYAKARFPVSEINDYKAQKYDFCNVNDTVMADGRESFPVFAAPVAPVTDRDLKLPSADPSLWTMVRDGDSLPMLAYRGRLFRLQELGDGWNNPADIELLCAILAAPESPEEPVTELGGSAYKVRGYIQPKTFGWHASPVLKDQHGDSSAAPAHNNAGEKT